MSKCHICGCSPTYYISGKTQYCKSHKAEAEKHCKVLAQRRDVFHAEYNHTNPRSVRDNQSRLRKDTRKAVIGSTNIQPWQ